MVSAQTTALQIATGFCVIGDESLWSLAEDALVPIKQGMRFRPEERFARCLVDLYYRQSFGAGQVADLGNDGYSGRSFLAACELPWDF